MKATIAKIFSIRQHLLLAICIAMLPGSLKAQNGPPNTKSEFEKMYKWRVAQEYLYGVYIPKDMGEAFAQLNQKIDKESKAKFKQMPEDTAVQKLHFSLGRWMIVNWSFYEGSRFSDYLKRAGITHPDDMAWCVIRCYHRFLNEKPLNVRELAEAAQEKRKTEKQQLLKSGTLIHQETRKKEGKN
jgi:hypothetical protein